MSQEVDHITPQVPETTDDGLALLVRQAEAMDAAHRIATALSKTSMVPKTFQGKPDDAAAAILHGAELGLKPQQALQQIFIVHGQPAIYARTMAALLKAKGYRFETVETTDETVTVTGSSPRGEEETATWTIDRAKKAGYTSNAKYKSDPQAMLYAKALSEVCRKLAPDVLLGIRYTAEDLELEPRRLKATATRQDRQEKPGGKHAVRAALAAKTDSAVAKERQENFENALAAIENAEDRDRLDKILNHAETCNFTNEQLATLSEAAAEAAAYLAPAEEA